MEVKEGQFIDEISGSRKLAIDTSILIYHLEDLEPYSTLTQALITRIAEQEVVCIISSLLVTELFTKPLASKESQKIKEIEDFLSTFPNLHIKSVDYEIAFQAAKLRARHNLRTPDAIHIATALVNSCDAFISNDISLLRVSDSKLKVLILDHFTVGT